MTLRSAPAGQPFRKGGLSAPPDASGSALPASKPKRQPDVKSSAWQHPRLRLSPCSPRARIAGMEQRGPHRDELADRSARDDLQRAGR